MDSDALLEMATAVKRFKMFPYFDVAHYTMICLSVKEDSYPAQFSGQQVYSRIHPLSCWFGSMLLCFAGGILGNFLLGEPLLEPLKNENNVLVASVVWYLVNYAPFDFVFKLCKFTPVKLIVSFLKEIHRAHKVNHAILFALKNFPGSYFLVCVFGVLKGSAALHMRIFQRLICGLWQPSNIEILKPTVVTKSSLVASIIFILKYKGFIDTPEELIYFGIVIYFSAIRLLYLLFGIDPFAPFETVFCFLFFGGLIDSIKKAVTKNVAITPANKNKNSSAGNKAKEE